jgi:hypothetical protein
MARGRKISETVTVRLKKQSGEKKGKLLKAKFKYDATEPNFSSEFMEAAVYAYGRAIAKKLAQKVLLSAGPIVQVNTNFIAAAIKGGKDKAEALKIAEMQHEAVNAYRGVLGKDPLPFLIETPKGFDYCWEDSQSAFDAANAAGESLEDDEDAEEGEDE